MKSKKIIPKRLEEARGQRSLAHGILLGPASSSGLILDFVALAHVSNFRHQRVIRIWIR